MNRDRLLQQVRRYYEQTLQVHGPTHRGVDWNTQESQHLRFAQFGVLMGDDAAGSVLDYGCGYGALAPFLRECGWAGEYLGFDLSERMIAAALASAESIDRCRFTASPAALQPADYVLASGLFNVKQDTAPGEWWLYIEDTLRTMASLARRGLAFNALTVYSDPDRQRPDLYYADPRALFDFCKRTISERVALLHDYPLFEFTIHVRL